MSEVEQAVEQEVAAPVIDFAAIGALASESENLTKDKAYERELPRAGVALLRLVEYIELGRYQPKNPTHKPSLKCTLKFELNHPDHMIEIEGKGKVPSIMKITLNKGTTGASGYRKLFKVMNVAVGGQHQHFASMLGEAFMGTVYHNEGTTKDVNGKLPVYANLDLDGAWSLKKPEQLDAMTNVATAIAVSECVQVPTVFLWENASLSDEQYVATWDNLYVDGEREVFGKKNEDGTPKMESKNWLQEKIMTNLEWEGSTLQALTQEHISLDDLGGEQEAPKTLADAAVAAPEDAIVEM